MREVHQKLMELENLAEIRVRFSAIELTSKISSTVPYWIPLSTKWSISLCVNIAPCPIKLYQASKQILISSAFSDLF